MSAKLALQLQALEIKVEVLSARVEELERSITAPDPGAELQPLPDPPSKKSAGKKATPGTALA